VKGRQYILTIPLVAALAVGLWAGDCRAQQVIVNPGVAQERLTADSVRALFTLRLRRWGEGSLVRVFVLPDRHPVHQSFVKKVLGVLPQQLRTAWDRMVFSGTGQAPVEVADEAQMRDWVASTPGAIGYVEDGQGDKRVRVVPVE
jgi:ABC-type phosphate transport system substrate-binding protein